MIPVISFIGRSNSGKTTLLCKVIKEIKSRGYKVAVIKHHHLDFEIDKPGKDTFKHMEAGADKVVISSPFKIAMIERVKEEISLDKIIEGIQDVDIIITEGYKREKSPKIEVIRQEISTETVSNPDELIAIVTDANIDIDILKFGLEDIKGLTNFIEEKFIL